VLGQVLRDYQTIVYTPGPYLFIAGLLACIVGFGVRGARRAKQRAPAFLLVGMAITLMGMAAAFEFSWRYQLPGLLLYPLAGALAITALTGKQVEEPAQQD
jgi:peptidoglycan/LPS O-acetylase OafA/YrhL